MSGKDLQEIEEVWHGITMPYAELFAWLDGKAERPDIDHAARFHPMMLSNPIDEDKDLAKLDPADFSAEWKWDGIRVQLVLGKGKVSMFSRTGDDIARPSPTSSTTSSARPCSTANCSSATTSIRRSFNDLQQRLNRKVATGKLLADFPAFVRVYDILFDGARTSARCPGPSAARASRRGSSAIRRRCWMSPKC